MNDGSRHPTLNPAVDRISRPGEPDRLVPSGNTNPPEFRETTWRILRELLRRGAITIRPRMDP